MAENSKSVRVNIKGLQMLTKALKGKYSVRVGVMGTKATREHKDTKLNNAEIGFLNEVGSFKRKIPSRSFLEMPLRLYLASYLLKKKKFSQKAIEKAVKDGKLLDLAKQVGVVAEEVVGEGFATRGFGNWVPNAPSTIARKGSDSPLIDTSELRRSITSEAKEI